MPAEPDPSLIARLSQAGMSETALFHFLLENIPDRIYFKDAQSRFIRISYAMARFFGLATPLAAVGKTDFDFFTREHAEAALADERHIMRTGEAIIGKVEEETLPGGKNRWAITTKMPLRNAKGDIVGTCGISKDFTHQKALEDHLAESNAKLSEGQQQLEKALDDLREMRQRLIDAERALTAANAAHKIALEIRDPLNIIQAGMDALRAGKGLDENASAAAILEEMRGAIDRAGKVIIQLTK